MYRPSIWQRVVAMLLAFILMALTQTALSMLVMRFVRILPLIIVLNVIIYFIVAFVGSYVMNYFTLPSSIRLQANHMSWFWKEVLRTAVVFFIVDIVFFGIEMFL
jgi:hypothetical protein